MQTHYDRLKVAPDAPGEVIRAAYRALSQRHHPDRNPGDAQAARTMQALNDAYAVLSDPDRRRAYDAALRTARPRTGTPRSTARGASGLVAPESPRPGVQARAVRSGPPPRPVWGGRRVAVVSGTVAMLALGGLAWHSAERGTPVPAAALPSVASGPEWTIHGLDPGQGESRGMSEAAVRPSSGPLDASRGAPRKDAPTSPADRPGPSPAAAPPASAGMQTPIPAVHPVAAIAAPAPGLVVADPNGRPWPFEAGYVDGLRQTHGDGLAAVTVDNRGGASAVFVKLVALDEQPAPAVRHVYLPAMGRFTIGQVRAGRYELHYQDLFTGRTTRSQPFELRRFESPAGARYSELDIAIHPRPAAMLPLDAPMAPAF